MPNHTSKPATGAAGSGLITGVATSITAFVGRTSAGPVDVPQQITSFGDFQTRYGGLASELPLTYAVQAFFQNGGTVACVCRLGDGVKPLTSVDYLGNQSLKTGLYQLEHVDAFNLLCIPPDTRDGEISAAVFNAAAEYCYARGALLIVDPPSAWTASAGKGEWTALDATALIGGEPARAAAVYFPRLLQQDVLDGDAIAAFAPCGAVAGLFAANDAERGVWMAPAGLQAGLSGVAGFEVTVDDNANGVIISTGINALRTFPGIGPVIWGARTMRGADALADDYKYVSVYRLTRYIEQSINVGLTWTVFQPNGAALWAAVSQSIGSFMARLMEKGAFFSYQVTCDATTTMPDDIAQGVVNVVVQFAPVQPAEFLVLMIQARTAPSS